VFKRTDLQRFINRQPESLVLMSLVNNPTSTISVDSRR